MACCRPSNSAALRISLRGVANGGRQSIGGRCLPDFLSVTWHHSALHSGKGSLNNFDSAEP